MKNPQTTIAPTFLTHIISATDGVNKTSGVSNVLNKCFQITSFFNNN